MTISVAGLMLSCLILCLNSLNLFWSALFFAVTGVSNYMLVEYNVFCSRFASNLLQYLVKVASWYIGTISRHDGD